MSRFKQLPEQKIPTKVVTLEELGLPVAADIEAMFWNTNNSEVCKAIESWLKTPDCSQASAERIAKAAKDAS